MAKYAEQLVPLRRAHLVQLDHEQGNRRPLDLMVAPATAPQVPAKEGQFFLYHHRLHQLTPALLKALTAVHNYVLRRPDGTTAAERFFGQKHGDLFAHLVTEMAEPARPRRRRKKEREPLLPMG